MCLKFEAKMNQILRTAVLAIASIIAFTGDASSQTAIRICNGNDMDDFDQNGRGQPGAFWPAYIEALFKGAGYEYVVESSTHKRCEIATLSEPLESDVTFGRVYSEDRAANYWMIPVYQQYSAFYFSTDNFPGGITTADGAKIAETTSDLVGRPICGFQGWDYSYYSNFAGFPKGWTPVGIPESDSENRFAKALELVVAGRCDAVEFPPRALVNVEVKPETLSKIGCFPLVKEPATIIYIMVSRKAESSAELAAKLFAATMSLTEARTTGELIKKSSISLSVPGAPDALKHCLGRIVRPLVD